MPVKSKQQLFTELSEGAKRMRKVREAASRARTVRQIQEPDSPQRATTIDVGQPLRGADRERFDPS